jgi:hypothetical protein
MSASTTCDLCSQGWVYGVGGRRACMDHARHAFPEDRKPWWRRLFSLIERYCGTEAGR